MASLTVTLLPISEFSMYIEMPPMQVKKACTMQVFAYRGIGWEAVTHIVYSGAPEAPEALGGAGLHNYVYAQELGGSIATQIFRYNISQGGVLVTNVASLTIIVTEDEPKTAPTTESGQT